MSHDDPDDRPLEVHRVDWMALAPHAARGVLFLVGVDAKLLDVARAVRDDDVERIQAWLAAGTMRRPTDDELAEWGDDPSSTWFGFVIVQPYVLAVRTDAPETSPPPSERN